jgi:uncharacterized protein YkwD
MIRRFAGATAAIVFCAGCMIPVGELPFPPPTDPEPAPPARVPGDQPYAAAAEQVLQEANRARSAIGARALVPDARLDAAAAEHAAELARRRVLDHESTRPDRRTVSQRVDAAGVAWRRIAENLAQLPGGSAAVASQSVRLWLDSPGHRVNLLEPAYTRSGVGIARDASGLWYVVQLYVLPVGGGSSGPSREP